MNAARPEYLATLVVSFPTGEERYQQGSGGKFQALDQAGLFQEIYCCSIPWNWKKPYSEATTRPTTWY